MNHDLALPADALWDAMLRFENFERYVLQSAATSDGKRAEPPPRERLSRELAPS